MSGVQGINNKYAVKVPDDFGVTLTAYAVAKPHSEDVNIASKTVTSVFKDVVSIKDGFGNPKMQPSASELANAKTIISRLRETYANTLPAAQMALVAVRAADKGLFSKIIGSPASREMKARASTLESHTKQLSSLLAQVEAKQETLKTLAQEMARREVTLVLPHVHVESNQSLKEQMPVPTMVFINSAQQESNEELFANLFLLTSVSNEPYMNIVNTRLAVFGNKEGRAPEGLSGKDLDVLKAGMPSRFEVVSGTLAAHCQKPQFQHKDKTAFFVPTEIVQSRKMHISKPEDGKEDIEICLETTFGLSRKVDSDPVANVTATYTMLLNAEGLTVKTCRFYGIVPVADRASKSDFEKLERIFPNKVSAAASTSAG